MPVIAVVAAVAVDAGAIGAFAGGLALGSTLGVLTAVTAIGATLGAIGAVTGNRTLGLIGAGLGLVGGIGSIATSAGLFGDAAASGADSIFGTSADAGSAASTSVDSLGVAGGAAPDALGVPGGVAGTGEVGNITTATGAINTGAFDPIAAAQSSLAAPEGSATGIVTGGDTTGALGQSLSPPTTYESGSTSWTGTPRADAFAPDNSGIATSGDLSPFKLDPASLSASIAKNPLDIGASPSSGIMGWARNNPLLAYGVLQAGGSFISGLTDPLKPAQIAALNAQAAANNAAAGLTQQEMKNMGQPIPTAVTGMPAATGGLINTKPAATPLITGAPAGTQPTTVTGATA